MKNYTDQSWCRSITSLEQTPQVELWIKEHNHFKYCDISYKALSQTDTFQIGYCKLHFHQ